MRGKKYIKRPKVGDRQGTLTVIGPETRDHTGRLVYPVSCTCGAEKFVRSTNLIAGVLKVCGNDHKRRMKLRDALYCYGTTPQVTIKDLWSETPKPCLPEVYTVGPIPLKGRVWEPNPVVKPPSLWQRFVGWFRTAV